MTTLQAMVAMKVTAFAAIIGLAVIHAPADPAPVDTNGGEGWWSLVMIESDGSEYVVDYNMTFTDCVDAIEKANPKKAWSCVRQPDMEGQPGGKI